MQGSGQSGHGCRRDDREVKAVLGLLGTIPQPSGSRTPWMDQPKDLDPRLLVQPPHGYERGLARVDFTQKGLAVQLYFGDADPSINTARFEALRAKQDQFEQALGRDAEWDEMTGRKAARVCVTSAFDSVADVEQWPAMMDWLLDQHVRFRRAIQAVGGLGSLA
jgi:Domain of unknown function (DUF4268)